VLKTLTFDSFQKATPEDKPVRAVDARQASA
jgi:hypothetical protein